MSELTFAEEVAAVTDVDAAMSLWHEAETTEEEKLAITKAAELAEDLDELDTLCGRIATNTGLASYHRHCLRILFDAADKMEG